MTLSDLNSDSCVEQMKIQSKLLFAIAKLLGVRVADL